MFRCFGIVLSLLATSAAYAVPVQWTSLSGGNDHWYDIIVSTAPLTWDEAKSDAESKTHLGEQGYLATFTSSGETAFLVAMFSSGLGGWIGGYQTDNLSEPAGNWAWVTGEAAPVAPNYTNWNAGEPNNVGGEHHMEILLSGAWNDRAGSNAHTAYVIEFDNSTVPEPSSLLLGGAGIMALALRMNRRK